MKVLPLLVLNAFLLVDGSPGDGNHHHFRTRTEQIKHAKEHKRISFEEFEKVIGDGPLAGDMERTSKFLQKMRESAGTLNMQPLPLSESDKNIVQEMDKLMEGRVDAFDDEVNDKMIGHLYEGDIILSEEEIARMEKELDKQGSRDRRAVIYAEAVLWPKNETIHYGYLAEYTEEEKAWFRKKLGEISENTCLKIEEKNDGFREVMFVRNGGCGSGMGYPGRNKTRTISIDNNCQNSIQHEFFHNLGFGHTFRRNDRDDFVTLRMDFLEDSAKFEKLYPHHEFHLTPPVSYDYKSIMHYKTYEYSLDGTPTFIPKESDYGTVMGQRLAPSFSDYKQVNMRYKCGEECPQQVQCENGGYPHPKKCNMCVCTDFYQGARCEQYLGITLTGDTPDKSRLTITYKAAYNRTLYNQNGLSYDFSQYAKFESKAVTCPKDKKLRITLTKIHIRQDECEHTCFFNTIEIIDTKAADLTMGGKMFCCGSRKGHSFISNSNVIGFRGWSAPGWEYDYEVTVEIVEPWTKNEAIRYGFASDYTDAEKAWFRSQLSQISDNSCLKMVEKNDGVREVLFKRGNGTGSLVSWLSTFNGSAITVDHNADYATTSGNRLWPTFADYKQINTQFKCGDQCPVPVKCEYGGYPHPRICGKCVCHDFAQGERCQMLKVKKYGEERESSSSTLNYDESWTTLYPNDGTWNTMNSTTHAKILPNAFVAPFGKKILVKFLNYNMPDEMCADKCPHGAFELIDNEAGDLTTSGTLLCCKKEANYSFVTKSNVLGFRGYVEKGRKFKLEFSVICADKRPNIQYYNNTWTLPDGTPIYP